MNKFTPRKGGTNTMVFVFGFMLFPVLGIITLAAVGMDDEMSVPAIICILLGLAAMAYILIRNAAAGFAYIINDDKVILKRGRLNRTIPINNIAAAGLLEGDKLKIFMSTLARPIAEARLQLNIGKWWQNSIVYGEIIKWVSVVITETETRAGGPLNIIKYTLNLDETAVTIKLQNGELLLITPVQTTAFIQALTFCGVKSLSAEECISSIPSPNLTAGPDAEAAAGKRKRIKSLITGFIIIAAVLTWFFTAGPGTNYETSATNNTVVDDSAQISTFGEWTSDSEYIFLMRADHPDADNVIEGGQRASATIISLAGESIVSDYQQNNPDSASIPDTDDVILMLKFTAVVRLYESRVNDSGVEVHIYTISADNLKNSVDELARTTSE